MDAAKGTYILRVHCDGLAIRRRLSWACDVLLEEMHHEVGRDTHAYEIMHPATCVNVLSYRWQALGKPDDNRHHLDIVSELLRKIISSRTDPEPHLRGIQFKPKHNTDVAMFWESLSLPQRDFSQKPVPQRTPDEEPRFQRGLDFCNVLYGWVFRR